MIALLMSLLGVGGIAGVALHLFGWAGTLRKVTSFGSGAKGLWQRIPRWLKIAAAVVIVLVASYFVHRHYVHKFKVAVQTAQMAADNDYWKRKLAAAHRDAINWKTQYETAQNKIANEERSHHEETVRNNAAIASALSVRGPGAAASHCGPVRSASTAASPSEPGRAIAPASAAAAPMPAEDWATVPWRWLVNVVQQHDDVTDEARAWRNQHARQQELHQQQMARVPR